jgi:hypothetical protein
MKWAAMALAAGLTVTALGAAGALAIPIDTEYTGHAKGDAGGSFVGFDVKKAHGEKKVKHFQVQGLDFECDGGSPGQIAFTMVDDAFPVDGKGEFGGRSHATIVPNFDPRAKVTGKLKPGGKAVGTIRMRGKLDPEGQPGVKCDTGTLGWKAEKGPPEL